MPYPFTFPVIAVATGAVLVHHEPSSLGKHPENVLSGGCPPLTIFAESNDMWRPVRVRAVARTGQYVFGQALVIAEFDFERVRTFELRELRGIVRASVEKDDDFWTQVMAREDVMKAITSASTFGELVAAIDAAIGSG